MTKKRYIVQCIIMRIIKRYTNRRLYDAKTSQTIHLEDIAEFIQNGEEIKAIDNTTGKDITSKVLAQTFLKIITSDKSEDFQVFLLSSLIKEFKSNLPNFLSRLIQGGIGTEFLTPEKLAKIIENFIGKGDLAIQEKEIYLQKLIGGLNLQQENIQKLLKKLLNTQKKIEKIEISSPRDKKIIENHVLENGNNDSSP